MRALVIPHDGSPVRELDVPREDALDVLQRAVGGFIEALPLPEHVDMDGTATAYVNEDGKHQLFTDPEGEVHNGLPINRRATDLLVPGVGLFWGDWIAGDLVVVGFDARRGVHRDIPAPVERTIRLIAREAG